MFIKEIASVIAPVGHLITFLTLLNLFLSGCHIPQFYGEMHTCEPALKSVDNIYHTEKQRHKLMPNACTITTNQKKHLAHKLANYLRTRQHYGKQKVE